MSFRVVVFGGMEGEEPISLFSKGRRACGQWYNRYAHLPSLLSSSHHLLGGGSLRSMDSAMHRYSTAQNDVQAVRDSARKFCAPETPHLSTTLAPDLPPSHPSLYRRALYINPRHTLACLSPATQGRGW